MARRDAGLNHSALQIACQIASTSAGHNGRCNGRCRTKDTGHDTYNGHEEEEGHPKKTTKEIIKKIEIPEFLFKDIGLLDFEALKFSFSLIFDKILSYGISI